ELLLEEGELAGNLGGLLELAQGRQAGGAERLAGLDLELGGDAGACPVGLGDGVDGAADGYPGAEVGAEGHAAAGVGAAAGDLADDGGAREALEVVGELLGAGEREAAG